MPKWVIQRDKPVLALLEEDMVYIKKHVKEAMAIWKRHYRDTGSCVIGAGIGIIVLAIDKKTKRESLEERIILSPPGNGSGEASARIVLDYLGQNGVAAFFIHGRMD